MANRNIDAKRDVWFHGVPLVIEWPKGSVREGEDKSGKPWKREMFCDYGFIPDTTAAGDGEDVDIYLGPEKTAPCAYVVEQLDPDSGEFDEFKIMLGFSELKAAQEMYLKHFPKELASKVWGGAWEVPVSEFLEAANKALDD